MIMAETVKITKTMVLETIKANIENMVFDGDVQDSDVVGYVDSAIAQLEAKKEKAREKAAEKAAEGDALREVVKNMLTEELQTRDEIFEKIPDSTGELTVAKVGARLSQLVQIGEARKEQVKRDTRRVMGYALAAGASEETDAE
jgi:hypothetical protein